MKVQNGYLVRKVGKKIERGYKYRDWWIIKAVGRGKYLLGSIELQRVSFPSAWIGRKVRFRVEIVEEEKVRE